jgi:hypothetical protein
MVLKHQADKSNVRATHPPEEALLKCSSMSTNTGNSGVEIQNREADVDRFSKQKTFTENIS